MWPPTVVLRVIWSLRFTLISSSPDPSGGFPKKGDPNILPQESRILIMRTPGQGTPRFRKLPSEDDPAAGRYRGVFAGSLGLGVAWSAEAVYLTFTTVSEGSECFESCFESLIPIGKFGLKLLLPACFTTLTWSSRPSMKSPDLPKPFN